MKKFKKMMALAIAMVMVLAMNISAFAANTNAHTITITNADQVGAHTYEAYQVFAGDYDATSEKLSNITWGAGVNGAGILAAVKIDTDTFGTDAANAATAEDVAKLLGTGNDTVKAKKFAAIVGANLSTTIAGTSTGEGPYTISVTGDGYYFVKDKAGTLPTDSDDTEPHKADSETRYMLKVVADVTVAAKSKTVESKKKVQDINDSTDTEYGGLQDSADHEIGDVIPYTLTFTLPANYADYEKYYVEFSDDMCSGLTLIEDSVKIQYGASGTKQPITFTSGTGTLGTLYTYEIEDLKKTADALAAGDVITITYNAYLNSSAVIGSDGNPNTYTVKFNNNPNKSGKGQPTGNTPTDKNIVFTYKTVFDKVDENNNLLEGADFKLEKKVGNEWIDVTKLGTSAHPKKVGSSADKSKTFEFQGLDDGEYRLTEIYTPKGYNSIDPITFKISASHDAESDDPKLTKLEAEGLEMEKDVAHGTLKTSIVNKSGAVLPSTGGVGTTMFYIVGAILAVGAGILLVTRRRMDAQ